VRKSLIGEKKHSYYTREKENLWDPLPCGGGLQSETREQGRNIPKRKQSQWEDRFPMGWEGGKKIHAKSAGQLGHVVGGRNRRRQFETREIRIRCKSNQRV